MWHRHPFHSTGGLHARDGTDIPMQRGVWGRHATHVTQGTHLEARPSARLALPCPCSRHFCTTSQTPLRVTWPHLATPQSSNRILKPPASSPSPLPLSPHSPSSAARIQRSRVPVTDTWVAGGPPINGPNLRGTLVPLCIKHFILGKTVHFANAEKAQEERCLK